MVQGVQGRTTGIFTPRLRGSTADGIERAATLPKTNLTTPVNPKALLPNVLGNFAYPTYEMQGGPSPEATGNAIFEVINNSMNIPTGGSGDGSNKYTDAIRFLQKQLDSGAYGKSYDRLSTQLGKTGRRAGRDIDAASLEAIAGFSSQDPMEQYTYAPSTAQIPQAALVNYLTSIGAGTNEVDANRDFLQQMINSENAQAMQYTNEIGQAQNAQRDAAIQAVYGNQAYSQSQLGIAQQAQQMAIEQAKEKERKDLNDQILKYILAGGKR